MVKPHLYSTTPLQDCNPPCSLNWIKFHIFYAGKKKKAIYLFENLNQNQRYDFCLCFAEKKIHKCFGETKKNRKGKIVFVKIYQHKSNLNYGTCNILFFFVSALYLRLTLNEMTNIPETPQITEDENEAEHEIKKLHK